MKIMVVAGARPNFMKVAPILAQLKIAQAAQADMNFSFVHTGQHYDGQMSQAFFADLDLPEPDVNLGIGSGSHAEQTGKVMMAFETLLLQDRPDWVIVVGDVNSTMACTITAKKLGVRVAHVEAGLRSRDWGMPEEINRLVTDVLSDALFTTDTLATANLQAEGIDPSRIHFVGNVMIDTLLKHRQRAVNLRQWEQLGLTAQAYAVLTLHRPSNVDDGDILAGIVAALEVVQQSLPIAFPAHPRTQKMARHFGLWERLQAMPNLVLLDPLGYLNMLSLTSQAALILTDSGGLQEEAVVLGVPCLTLRENTERPITVSVGANEVIGNKPEAIIRAVKANLAQGQPQVQAPEYWDGCTAQRIVTILLETT